MQKGLVALPPMKGDAPPRTWLPRLVICPMLDLVQSTDFVLGQVQPCTAALSMQCLFVSVSRSHLPRHDIDRLEGWNMDFPSSLALRTGVPRMMSTSMGFPFSQSVRMLLPMGGMASILSISRSIREYSIGTSEALATSITSCIKRRVIGIAPGDDFSHVCVSSSVKVVSEFQAAFQTTFSHLCT